MLKYIQVGKLVVKKSRTLLTQSWVIDLIQHSKLINNNRFR